MYEVVFLLLVLLQKLNLIKKGLIYTKIKIYMEIVQNIFRLHRLQKKIMWYFAYVVDYINKYYGVSYFY